MSAENSEPSLEEQLETDPTLRLLSYALDDERRKFQLVSMGILSPEESVIEGVGRRKDGVLYMTAEAAERLGLFVIPFGDDPESAWERLKEVLDPNEPNEAE